MSYLGFSNKYLSCPDPSLREHPSRQHLHPFPREPAGTLLSHCLSHGLSVFMIQERRCKGFLISDFFWYHNVCYSCLFSQRPVVPATGHGGRNLGKQSLVEGSEVIRGVPLSGILETWVSLFYLLAPWCLYILPSRCDVLSAAQRQ